MKSDDHRVVAAHGCSGVRIVIVVLATAVALLCLSSLASKAQESCANLQNQLQVLRGSGGAGSQWDSFILQQMQRYGCFGGQSQQPQYQPPPQPVGDYCPGGGTCPVGFQCTSVGKCMPQGNTECGGNSCGPGQFCGSRNHCMPEGKRDCGNGSFCSADSKCARDGKRCLSTDAVDCGTYSCSAGAKCGSGNSCLSSTAVDCGGGKSCPAGNVCLKGGAECVTPAQLAERNAAERRQKEIAAQEAASRQAEERRRIEQHKHDQQIAAASKRASEAQERARNSIQKAVHSVLEKDERQTATTKASVDPILKRIADDPKQSTGVRETAKRALGTHELLVAPGEMPGQRTQIYVDILHDPKAPVSTKQIAAIALGLKVDLPANAYKPDDNYQKLQTIAREDIPKLPPPVLVAEKAKGKNTAPTTIALTDAQLDYLRKNISNQTSPSPQGQTSSATSPSNPNTTAPPEGKTNVTAAPPKSTSNVTGFTDHQISQKSNIEQAKNSMASAIVDSLKLKTQKFIKYSAARNKIAVEYVTDSPEVKAEIEKIALKISVAQGGEPAQIALKIKSTYEAGFQTAELWKGGDKYSATLKAINLSSSLLAEQLHFPPGSVDALNLSGAAATAYIYGYFFGS